MILNEPVKGIIQVSVFLQQKTVKLSYDKYCNFVISTKAMKMDVMPYLSFKFPIYTN